MLKRIITGTCYAAIICGFFLLREVDYRLFAILIYMFAIIGTYEIARALKPWLVKGNYNALLFYGVLIVPIYCIFEYIIENGSGAAVLLVSLLLSLIWSVVCFTERKSFEIVAANTLGYFYPAVFIVAMLLCNDLGHDRGFIALLIPFVTSALSDTFAYFTGSLIGGKKLCPKLSPKKTWSGAVGGVLGGIVGALLIYFIFMDRIHVNFPSPILLFVITGIFASILTIIGDLFESLVKRKVGIKDMGNLLPGHGGILDRIDGTAFVALYTCLMFLIV